MNRREFLKHSTTSSIALGLGSLASFQALAADPEAAPWFFVQIHMSGGWDVTLGTNPWLKQKPADKEMFIEYDPSNIEHVGNIAFGPSMLPMKPFASEMSLINGIFMSATDNGHDAAENYILSGSTNQTWGVLPVEILENRPSKFLGILNNQGVYTGSRSSTLTALSAVQSLATGNASEGGPFESTENARNLLSRLQGQLANSAGQVQDLKDRLAAYAAAGSQLSDSHYLAASFAAGFSQVAFYRISDNLDTHSAHPANHINLQLKSWTKISEMLAVFKKTPLENSGQSLYDRTTFFITSEFARTAALNSSQGKDHNPLTNSVVLIGPSIKGNNVVGDSHLVTAAKSKSGDSYHLASPIDAKTGQALEGPAEGAMIIRPENVAATVIESLGISRRRFASVNPKIQSLTSLVKK